MHFLREFKILGIEEFLQEQEKFIKRQQPNDRKAIFKNLEKWRTDPCYPSLNTQKMQKIQEKDGLSVWECRMTKKIRMRFIVHMEKQVMFPEELDLHDDRDSTIERLLERAANKWVGKIKECMQKGMMSLFF